MARYKESDLRKCVENKCNNKIRPRVYNANVDKCKTHAPAKYCARRNCEWLRVDGHRRCKRCMQHITRDRQRPIEPVQPTNPIGDQPDISIIVDGDLTCEQVGDILCIKNIEDMLINNVFSIKTYD